MKSSKELKELREEKISEARTLAESLKDKELTDEQRNSLDTLQNAIDTLKGDITRAEKLEETLKVETKKAANVAGHSASKSEEKELDKIAKDFTFGEAVRAAYGLIPKEGAVREMHSEGEKEMQRIGKDSRSNSVVIPSGMLKRMNVEKRANITENTTTGIQNTDFVQSVYAQTVLGQRGATFIDAVQDVRVPIIGAVSTQWEGETDASADGGSATTKVDLTPIRLGAYVNFSKQAALQANYSLEGALRQAFAQAIAAKFELACFTDDSGNGSFAYLGSGKTAVTGGTATAMANALIEEVLGNNHLQGNTGFVWSHDLYTEVETAVLATGVSALVQNGNMLGYGYNYSTQVADIATGQEAAYFGDWSKVWAAQFGGIELLLDPYTQAASGMDRLVLNSFWDMALIQDAAISVAGYTG